MFQKDGIEVIDGMLGKFQAIIDGLNKGIQLVNTKRKENDVEVTKLMSENETLDIKAARAKKVSDNLTILIADNDIVTPACSGTDCDCTNEKK
jgi:hypothetical protein